MKAIDIFEEAVTLCDGDDVEEYRKYGVTSINLALGEIFHENNSLREYKGKEPLEKIPRIEKLDDEVATEDEFSGALQYNIASKLLIATGETDEGKHVIYNNYYIDEVNRHTKAKEYSVEDVYE